MTELIWAAEQVCAPAREMSRGRLWQAYLTEARYESLRMFRVLGFSIPFLVLPAMLFLLFGVVMFGDQARADPGIAMFLFVAFAVFGVMGPGMFSFGASLATEREQGLLTLKRALPAPRGSYLLAKMAIAMLFALVVMVSMLAIGISLGHLRLTLGQCLAVTGLCVVGSLPFCAIGLFIGSRMSGKGAMATVNCIYVPMMHISGLFYPLPKALKSLAPLWPSHHLQQLVLHALGMPNIGQVWVHALALAGVTVLLGVLAVRRLERVG